MDGFKLEIQDLTKIYPGTVALQNFSTIFNGGNVYALLGKNGSGKSTLVKCISGAICPTDGRMMVNGKPLAPKSPLDAFAAGIAVVYQELSVIPDLSVTENVLLGRYSKKGPGRLMIDWGDTRQRAEAILKALSIPIPAAEMVRNLSVGQQQLVEIAKAMSFNPAVLILDEPTSALAQNEVESLFGVIRRLKAQGVIVIYITHRLQELPAIADFVTVLRDGVNIGTIPIETVSPKKIVEMIFGEVPQIARPDHLEVSREVALEVRNLHRKSTFSNIHFRLHKGEILGIAGMLGSGRSELLRAIFGADAYDSGEITINGKKVSKAKLITMKRLGLAMIPENRKEEGLVQTASIGENLCFASMERMAVHGFLSPKRQAPYVYRQINDLQIKCSDASALVSSLSGGNQQKVVIGNWLNAQPQVIFFDEPTRGIDVRAKQQIFEIIWDLSRQGLSSIFVSTELEELLEVCHRILIMRRGEIVAEVIPAEISLEKLYSLCMEA